MTELVEAALDYAARGWYVFPCHTPTSFGPKTGEDHALCSCGQSGCESQGKHPRIAHGLHDASTDPDTIRRWWQAWPDANVALRTGDTFDVFDIDEPRALDTIGDGQGPEIITPMIWTGKGLHMYFAASGRKNRTGFVQGCDWRGKGGYVIAPPSLHHLGHRYEWTPYGPETPLAAVPSFLVTLLDQPKPRRSTAPRTGSTDRSEAYGLSVMEREVGRVACAAEGTRNDALNRAAFSLGQLVGGGQLDRDDAISALLTVALRTGLSEHEAVTTIRSGMSAGMADPRRPRVSK